jgi:hypothetical protein
LYVIDSLRTKQEDTCCVSLANVLLLSEASKPNKKPGLRGASNVDSEKVPAEQPEHHQESHRGQLDPQP